MKNTKKAKIILGITIATAFLATVTASLTWFDNRVNLNPSINGSSAAAYFAYGDGTSEHPYGIRTPRHLYNLAWLQYLGEFNKDGVSQPVYFELDGDVDMKSSSNIGALPPIGNSNNPFLGVFNGKNYTISNLTISDSFTDFKTTPYSVTSGDYTSDNILGMFGVVGDSTKETNPDTSVFDFKLKNPTIISTGEKALAGIVAGYVNASVSSIGVIEPTINLEYKSTSGTITNTTALGTVASLNNTNFTNVSDYSVVGYCTDNYKSSVSSSVTEMKKTNIKSEMVPNAPGGSGEGQNDWGGSIDMKELYERLSRIKNSDSSTVINYVDSVKMNDDGTQIDEHSTPVKINSWDGVDKHIDFKYNSYASPELSFGEKDTYYFGFKEYSQNANNEKTSSIAFVDSPDSRDQNSIGLTGGADRYIIDGKTIDLSSKAETAGKKQKQIALFYEKKGTDNIYLKVVLNSDSSTSMSTTTNPAEASMIQLEKNTEEETYTISTTISGKTYYLNGTRDTNNNITDIQFTTTANPVKWKYDKTGAKAFCLVENPIYYFALDSDYSKWGLNAGGVSYNLYIDTTTPHMYFNNNEKEGADFPGSTLESEATKWFLEDGYVYRIRVEENKENKAAYLTHTGTGLKTSLPNSKGGISKTYTYFITNDDSVYIYYYDQKQLFYPVYSNGKWTESNGIDLAKYSDDQIKEYISNKSNGVTLFKRSNKSSFPFLYSGQDGEKQLKTDSQFTTPDTYIPLQQESDGIPSNSNTGYIVGGTDYFTDYYGDIRISDYNKEQNLGISKESSSLNTVYTIDTEGKTSTISDGSNFKKYASSKTQMEAALTTESVYGLHFMNAKVGPKKVGEKKAEDIYVTIPSAKINGVDIKNYQVPDDCIDFTLKEDGIINFFAGTYYPGNNCFFSLYQIERDDQKNISSINKIEVIYKEPTKYINGTGQEYALDGSTDYVIAPDQPEYKFKYSDSSTTPTWKITNKNNNRTYYAEGTKVLDSSEQLGKDVFNSNYMNSVFYFEIPVTAGEYALGSVDGVNNNGAYLMYLDIGTNSGLNADVKRTMIYESMTTTTNLYSSFMGVTFISAANDGTSNTYCIVLKTGATGVISFDVDGVTGTASSETNELIAVSFKKDNSVVKINGTEAKYTNPIKEKVVTTIKRVTYIDVLTDGKKNMVQVTSTTTQKNDETEKKSQTTKTYYTIDDQEKLTVSTETLYFADANGHNIEEPTLDKLPENGIYSEETMLSFDLDTETYGTINITFEPSSYNYNKDDNTYSIGGYNILISGDNLTEDTQVTITKITSNTYQFTFNGISGEETITITIPKSSVSSN